MSDSLGGWVSRAGASLPLPGHHAGAAPGAAGPEPGLLELAALQHPQRPAAAAETRAPQSFPRGGLGTEYAGPRGSLLMKKMGLSSLPLWKASVTEQGRRCVVVKREQ